MKYVQEYIVDLQHTLDLLPFEEITEIIGLLHEARLSGKTIFVMGNGGSASTASHIVCDFAKNTRQADWPPFKVMEFVDSSPIFTAYCNDEGYENAIAQQLAHFIEADDVVLGISTSGNSPNVLKAIELANEAGAITISFTGFDGGRLRFMTTYNVHVPSHNIEQVEDIHLVLGHLITSNLRLMTQQMPESTFNLHQT
ncbi:MAG: SIS domain-containing protein [Ardenticatenaceae bacterium]|nr:SIS domain-containing protein [Ardenticatenaceae bacterium]